MPGLAPRQVETFWSEGFVAPLPALGPAEARNLRDWVETFERDYPHDRWAFNLKANLLFESIDRLVRDARFLGPVEDLIGPNLLISTATFRIKEACSLGYYGWHQDDRFIQMGPCWVLTSRLGAKSCTPTRTMFTSESFLTADGRVSPTDPLLAFRASRAPAP